MSKSLCLVALLTATASANSLVATDDPDSRPAPRLVDGRLGMMLGGANVGDTAGFSAGLSTGLGYRIGNVTLRGLFDFYKVGDNSDEATPRRGRATRAGGAVRYSFANNGDDGTFGVDFWGELGAGFEHVEWRAGGVHDRPDGELAFGVDLGSRSERDHHGHRREIGYFMAFRSLIGDAPEPPGAMATCGGPCTKATTPPRTDVSMFFELGVHWGR